MEQETKTYIKVDDLIKQAEDQFKQFIKDGKYKDLLLSMSNLNGYSVSNQLLILQQLPTATCVNGMKVWNYNHRNIIKGERAIKIIAPLKEIRKEDVLDEDGNVIDTKEIEVIGYKVSHVFDISQTEGRELYSFKCDENIAREYFETIKNALERVPRGYTVKYQDTGRDGLDGYCDLTNKEIVIQDGMPFERTLTTLVHEIGHALAETRVRTNFKGLTIKEQTKIKEIEAESIALVVSNRLGLHTQEFNVAYISKWADGDIEKFKSNVDVVRSVSYQILSSVEPAVQSAIKDRENAIIAEAQAKESISNAEQSNTQDTQEQAQESPISEPEAKPKAKRTSKKIKEQEVEQC